MTIEISNRNDLVPNLESSIAEIEKQLAQINDQRRQVTAQLKQMQSLLNSLTNGATEATKRKPSPTHSDVTTAVVAILEKNGPSHAEVLKEGVETRLTEAGKSRLGLAIRLKQVLSSDQFVESDGVYTLAASAPTEA